jgi:DNA repair protein RadC
MLNVYCWKCGTRINEENILGLGYFSQQIGKYRGKGFIAFNCPQCKKERYQILDVNLNAVSGNFSVDLIDINQVIDFYRVLKDVKTVENFLERCEASISSINSEIKRAILQPLDVYKLFAELNDANFKQLMILTLDKDNYLINCEFLGEGANRPVSYEPRTIFRVPLLMKEKTAVIIAENFNKHFTQPTQKEILMTKRLIKAGKILGIDFLDHIVIEDNGFHSYDQLNYI